MSYEFKVFTCFNQEDIIDFINYINSNELRRTSIVELYNEWGGTVWISIEHIISQYAAGKLKRIIFAIIVFNNCIVGIANNLSYSYSHNRLVPLLPIDTNLICNVRIAKEAQGKNLCEPFIANLINNIFINNLTEPIILEVLINNISAIKCYCKNSFNDQPIKYHDDYKTHEQLNWMILDKNLYIKNLIKKLAVLSYNINMNISSNIEEHRFIKHTIRNYLRNYPAHGATKIE